MVHFHSIPLFSSIAEPETLQNQITDNILIPGDLFLYKNRLTEIVKICAKVQMYNKAILKYRKSIHQI